MLDEREAEEAPQRLRVACSCAPPTLPSRAIFGRICYVVVRETCRAIYDGTATVYFESSPSLLRHCGDLLEPTKNTGKTSRYILPGCKNANEALDIELEEQKIQDKRQPMLNVSLSCDHVSDLTPKLKICRADPKRGKPRVTLTICC